MWQGCSQGGFLPSSPTILFLVSTNVIAISKNWAFHSPYESGQITTSVRTTARQGLGAASFQDWSRDPPRGEVSGAEQSILL